MKFEKPANSNYAATIIRVPTTIKLEGLDRLWGVPALGHQALTTRDTNTGDLRIAFTAETALDSEYASINNLHRDPALNNTDEVGYLEPNRRIKAIKLKGHRSDALLMPLESLEYTGIDITELQEGDTFDKIGEHEICRKYMIPVKGGAFTQGKSKVEKAFSRVDEKLLPLHFDTDSYFRYKNLLREDREIVVTAKLHGSSIRVGHVPVRRTKGWLERIANKLGVQTPEYEYDMVYASRKVIKDANDPNQTHWYESDIWTLNGKKLDGLLPEGYIAYGELIGWTPEGKPVQKGYTYDVAEGEADLYIYRVAVINQQGVMVDLSWDAVREFCTTRGLKHVPEIGRLNPDEEFTGVSLDYFVDWYMDRRYAELTSPRDPQVPLSNPKTVDEGICLRQDGMAPLILKAKCSGFLQFETKQLDAGVADLESVA